MSEKQSIKINSMLNVIKTVSSIIFPLITFPYISRILQPVNVGKLNFANSFVNYFMLIATLGINTYAIRECSAVRNDRKKLNKVSSEIFSINICTTLMAYLFLIITLMVADKVSAYRSLILIQSISIIATTLGADWINTALEDFKYITIRTIAFQVISLCMMFLFVRQSEDYLIYAVISVISSCGASILNIFYRRKFCHISFTFNMQWKKHFKAILYLLVMLLAQTVFNSADITMLGLIKGDYEVGLYSTAVKLESIIAQVVSSLAWVVMPRMASHFAENDYEKINSMLKKILQVLFLIGFPLVAGVLAIAEEIVMILGGIEYIDAANILRILMFSFLFSLYGGSFLGNMILLPSKKEKEYMKICFIAAVINVVLNFVVIPYWGANGAALTTVIASFTILLLLARGIDKHIKLDNIFVIGKGPFLGSIGIIIFCYIIKQNILSLYGKTLFCCIGSVLLYVIVLIVTKNQIFIEIVCSMLKRLKVGKNYDQKRNC